ncbi:MAG: GtrA family protein [Candidatus Pacebacteria bacterium]|nr:GtrA family protein [Candidatus Paceibacterota bacterium]
MFSPKIQRFIKYSSIGISTFLLDLCLLWIFIEVLEINYLIAAGVAFLIAVSINYVLSRRYVFRDTLRSVGAGYLNFLIIAGFGLLLVVGGMYVLVEFLALTAFLARVVIAAVTGLWNYLMNLYVNFKVAGNHQS